MKESQARRNRFAIAAIGFLVSGVSWASDSWRYEASLAHVASKEEQAPHADYPTLGATFSLMFSSLPLSGDYPFAEAHFAERAGSVGIRHLVGDYEDDNVEKHDVSALAVFANLMHPDTDFAARVSWRKARFSDARYKPTFLIRAGNEVLGASVSPSSETIDMDTLAFSLGYFVRKHLLVGYGHTRTTADITYEPPVFSSESSKSTSDRLFVQFLGKIGGETYLAADLTLDQVESGFAGGQPARNRVIAVQGRYYPNRMHGVSLELGRNTGDNKDGEGVWYGVGYDAFVTSRFNVGGSFREFSAKDKIQGEDEKTLAVYASYRF